MIIGSAIIAETVAGLGDVAIAGPREVIGHHGDLVGRQHVQHFHPRLRRLLRIGVVGEFHQRLFQQQHPMVGEVAEEGEGFSVRGHHEHVVADGMSGRRHRLNAGQEFLAVLEEHQAVAHRQQIFSRMDHEILQRAAQLAFVGPEIEIALGDVELRVRE